MIVELDPKGTKAWGIYPGGQSGNPGHPNYSSMIKGWASGRYKKLLFNNKPFPSNNNIVFTKTFNE